jgi:DNA-binding transcriptional MerR regulator
MKKWTDQEWKEIVLKAKKAGITLEQMKELLKPNDL